MGVALLAGVFAFIVFLYIQTAGFTFEWGGGEGWASADPLAGFIFGLVFGSIAFGVSYVVFAIVWGVIKIISELLVRIYSSRL